MSIDQIAVALILIAAFLHAVTNALIKTSDDALLTRGFMRAVSSLISIPFIALVPPPTAGVWPFLIASMLVHALYPFLVAAACRRGDLSIVFPIARGISPLGVMALVALFGSATLTAVQLAGVMLISAGIPMLVLEPSGWQRQRTVRGPMIGFACATGIVVAIYTFLDGQGLPAAETTLSYIVWLVLLDGALTSGLIAVARRETLAPFFTRRWKHGLLAAVLGLLNFAMALYALGLGAMVEIAAIRETSILFAAFLGTRVPGEEFAKRRMVAALVITGGIITMQIFR